MNLAGVRNWLGRFPRVAGRSRHEEQHAPVREFHGKDESEDLEVAEKNLSS